MKRWLPYIFISLLFVVVVLIMDLQKAPDNKHEPAKQFSPFDAVFKIKDVIIPYKAGNFEWIQVGVEDVTNEEELFKLIDGQPYTLVQPMSVLELSFEKKPNEIQAGYWTNNFLGQSVYFSYITNSMTLTNQPGKKILIVHAIWENEDAYYVLPIEIKQTVSYQRLLAEEAGAFSYLHLHQYGKDEEFILPDEAMKYIQKSRREEFVDSEDAKNKYPDLKIETVPYFAVFDDQTVVLEAYKFDDVIDFFEAIEPK